MIGTLLLVGITLSLDNFRTALALGALRLTRRRALHVALVFGFWDGVAPKTCWGESRALGGDTDRGAGDYRRQLRQDRHPEARPARVPEPRAERHHGGNGLLPVRRGVCVELWAPS